MAGNEVKISVKLDDNGVVKNIEQVKGAIEDVKKADKGMDFEGTKSGKGAAEQANEGFTLLKGTLANLAATAVTQAVAGVKDLADTVIEVGQGFETSMSKVSALSGATGDDLAALQGKARELGASTTFSASEAADALGYMALAGWDTEQMLAGVGSVLTLAQAGEMQLAEASDLVTDYLSAFNMEASETSRMVDVLAYAQANANTTVEGLGAAFKNCAANANAAGMDIETTTAAISMMANQGLKGQEAGTALNAVMRDMTAQMKDGAIAVGDQSIAVMDAQGNYRDFADILADVESATDGMGDAEKAAALQSTFTADSIKGLNLLLNAGSDELDTFRDQLYNAGGTAEETADTMTDNLGGDLAALNSAFEETCIKIYEELQEPLRDFTKFLTNKVIPGVEDVIENFDEIAPVLAGVASGILILVNKGKLLKISADIVKTFGKAMTFLKTETNGATGAMKASGTAVAGVEGKVKASTVAMNAARGAAIGVGAALKGIAPLAAMTLLIEVITAVGGALSEAKEHGENMRAATDDLANAQNNMYSSMQAAKAGWEESDGMIMKCSSSLDEVKEKVDDAIQANINLASSLTDIYSEAGTSVGMLDGYRSTIDELAGRADLSTEDVAKLEIAVSKVNDQCGTAYDVSQDANGAWQIMADGAAVAKDSVLELCDAQMLQIQLQANQQAYEEAYKTHSQNVAAAAEAQAKYNEANEVYENLQQRIKAGEEGLDEEYQQAIDTRIAAKDTLDDANRTLDSSTAAMQAASDMATLYQMAMDGGADSIARAVAENNNLTGALTYAGQSSLEFMSDMETVGVSAEQLAGINQEAAAEIAQAYDGTYSSIADILSNHGIVVDEATAATQKSLEEMGLSIQDIGNLSETELQELQTGFDGTLWSVARTCAEKGIEIPQALQQAIAAEGGMPAESINTMMTAMVLELTNGNVEEAARILGGNIDQGLIDGIANGDELPAEAAGIMSEKTIEAVREGFDTHSPSKVMEAIGSDIDAGLKGGIEKNQSNVVSAMGSIVSNMLKRGKENAESGVSDMKGTLNKGWSGMNDDAKGKWSAIESNINGQVKAIKSNVNGMDALKATVRSIFSAINDTINRLMNTAQSAVSGAIGSMKKAFNFRWSLPPIKLPHFRINGEFSLNPPSVPSIGIDWYAKGGVFNSASVIGVGEAGKEAVLPLTNKRAMAEIGEAIGDEGSTDTSSIIEELRAMRKDLARLYETFGEFEIVWNNREVARAVKNAKGCI